MEDRSTLWFVFGVLAVWRMTHLLHLEHGPWGVVARARAAAGRLGLGDVFECFYCLSLWVAIPAAGWLGRTWPECIIAWLAISAGAILVEVRGVGSPIGPPRE